MVLAALLRYDFALDVVEFRLFIIFAFGISAVNFVVGKIAGLYRSRYKTASLDELLSLVSVTGVVGAIATIASFVWGPFWGVPRSTVIIATPIYLIFSGGVRILRRLVRTRPGTRKDSMRALIYGAGDLAEILIPQLLADRGGRFKPIGLVDDDPEKLNRWISGVRMKGLGKDLEGILRETRADVVIVAVPRAASSLFSRIEAVTSRSGVEVFVLPSFTEMIQFPRRNLELQNLAIEDLVGRKAVNTDLAGVGAYLTGMSVLITGAGGSIGVELCRQVAAYGPRELIFLDRDETGLQLAELATTDTGLLDNSNFVLVDIRDSELVREVFLAKRPNVVIHAAALKHLPVLERFPFEAWKTNVLGTLNVLEAAAAAGVDVLINISTDKAADPSSVLGRSKRIAEELTSWFAEKYQSTYVSVRFGNVLGSRGSLVPTLAHMIRTRGRITVTHRDATRFFMTIPEASQLVLQAGALGTGSEVFVLDMGEPVRILDLAEKMIALSGKKVDIVYTGLRTGEKLHEELFSDVEVSESTAHELIFRVTSKPLNPADLEKLESFVTSGR